MSLEEACYSALGESIETAIAASATVASAEAFEAVDLCREGVRFCLPPSAVVLSMRLADRVFGEFDAFSSSGGLAVHGSREGASDHALSELVERPLAAEFLSTGFAERPIARELAMELLGEVAARVTWDCFSSASFHLLGRWPLRTAVACVEAEDFGPGHRFAGFGSHRQLGGALRAALLEAVQSYVTHVVGLRDDIPHLPNARGPGEIRWRSPELLREDPGILELSSSEIAREVARQRGARVGIVDLAERHDGELSAFVVKCVTGTGP